MELIVVVVLSVGALYCLHRLGLWAEQRGWIYYRKKQGSSGTLSSAVLGAQTLLEPSKRYVLEETTRQQLEEDESGDPARPEVGVPASKRIEQTKSEDPP